MKYALAPLALLLAACATAGPPPELAGTRWLLAGSTPERGQAELLFLPQQRLAGSGGCNRLMGGYAQNGEALKIGKLATTMMACPNMQAEQVLLGKLESVTRFRVEQGELVLLGADGGELARYQSAPAQP